MVFWWIKGIKNLLTRLNSFTTRSEIWRRSLSQISGWYISVFISGLLLTNANFIFRDKAETKLCYLIMKNTRVKKCPKKRLPKRFLQRLFYLFWKCFVLKIPAGNYMFKVNNRNTGTRCEICSKLTIKIPERCRWRRSSVFAVNFEHISHFVLVFLLLTLSK